MAKLNLTTKNAELVQTKKKLEEEIKKNSYNLLGGINEQIKEVIDRSKQ